MKCVFAIFLLVTEVVSLESIEQQLHALEIKKKYIQRAIAEHTEKASRYQFSSNFYLDSRMEYELLQREEDRIRLVNKQIKKLQEQKKELLANEGFCVK